MLAFDVWYEYKWTRLTKNSLHYDTCGIWSFISEQPLRSRITYLWKNYRLLWEMNEDNQMMLKELSCKFSAESDLSYFYSSSSEILLEMSEILFAVFLTFSLLLSFHFFCETFAEYLWICEQMKSHLLHSSDLSTRTCCYVNGRVKIGEIGWSEYKYKVTFTELHRP